MSLIGVLLVMFQFTHPGRGATTTLVAISAHLAVSIHAPREGCDWSPRTKRGGTSEFQFTHPGRGATGQVVIVIAQCDVSIHAPREGCDSMRRGPLAHLSGFNSRTPGGVRLLSVCTWCRMSRFQFTHPGRGATSEWAIHPLASLGFNSRTPGGVRRQIVGVVIAPLMFQFTHPGRGATVERLHVVQDVKVSIHAPREGCDQACGVPQKSSFSFNSRTPGGVRPYLDYLQMGTHLRFNSRTPGGVRLICRISLLRPKWSFNSRTPGGVRHRSDSTRHHHQDVSIHAPREGCDLIPAVNDWLVKWFQFTHPGRGATSASRTSSPTPTGFNSRTPGGVRLVECGVSYKSITFQFTHPGRGATAQRSPRRGGRTVSIHAPREGCD